MIQDKEITLPSFGPMQKLLRHEAAGGICLMVASVLAMLFANIGFLSVFYGKLLKMDMIVTIGGFGVDKPLLLWINDGLMAIFFFLVGLEVKREFMRGELSSRQRALLPLMAALGGIVFPALVFYVINLDSPESMRGWAIPAATDIAFAIGVIGLLGSRVPASLKVFLTAIAVIDDLAAIVIIALFYTHELSTTSLLTAAIGLCVLFVLNRAKVKKIAPYILVGVVIWLFVLKSGVHATLAGVLIAFFIPMDGKTEDDESPLEHLEHSLHPWVSFMVLPIFGFANAGLTFDILTYEMIVHPLTVGIAAGLFFGKQVGIFLFSWIAILTGMAQKPMGATWRQIYGVGALCGIGFTMSLFIGNLAFNDAVAITEIRFGVLVGSLASAALGCILLWKPSKQENVGTVKAVG